MTGVKAYFQIRRRKKFISRANLANANARARAHISRSIYIIIRSSAYVNQYIKRVEKYSLTSEREIEKQFRIEKEKKTALTAEDIFNRKDEKCLDWTRAVKFNLIRDSYRQDLSRENVLIIDSRIEMIYRR